jgi:biotin-(acetyl-CoA carboxylase) ligase
MTKKTKAILQKIEKLREKGETITILELAKIVHCTTATIYNNLDIASFRDVIIRKYRKKDKWDLRKVAIIQHEINTKTGQGYKKGVLLKKYGLSYNYYDKLCQKIASK